jgi:hypothetical protein
MMDEDEERCAEARKLQRIDDAFRQGDLDALRTAVDDPASIPNGRMPDTSAVQISSESGLSALEIFEESGG